MILKSDCMNRPIDAAILENKVLFVYMRTKDRETHAAGFTVTLGEIRELVESTRGKAPETAYELIQAYATDEAALKEADTVEIFTGRESAYCRSAALCEWVNISHEPLRAELFQDLIDFYCKELPESVDYLCC